jgi:hypothetical protein
LLKPPPETPNLTTFLYRKAGMCQHTVLNDGLVCGLQDRDAVFYMGSWTNIVREIYMKVLQKIQIFSPMILAKHCQKAVIV